LPKGLGKFNRLLIAGGNPLKRPAARFKRGGCGPAIPNNTALTEGVMSPLHDR
jgi:hypothetical protein